MRSWLWTAFVWVFPNPYWDKRLSWNFPFVFGCCALFSVGFFLLMMLCGVMEWTLSGVISCLLWTFFGRMLVNTGFDSVREDHKKMPQ